MMDLKSIKTPKYYDNFGGENWHICSYMCRFLQQCIYTTKVAPFTGGQQRGSTLSWPFTVAEWIAEAMKLALKPLLYALPPQLDAQRSCAASALGDILNLTGDGPNHLL